MEARRNADKNMSGDAVAFALNRNQPGRAVSGGGAKTKDHARHNRDLIRAMQADAKRKAEEERRRRARPTFRLRRFASVDSRVGKETKASSMASRESMGKESMEGASNRGRGSSQSGSDDLVEPMSSLRVGDGPTSTTSTRSKHPKNFIHRNMKRAIEAHPPQVDVSPVVPITSTIGFGRVPLYIHQRKVELARREEERRREKQKEKLPPGMTLMSEEERQRTVELLQENQAKLMHELAMMPLTIETPSLLEKQNQINMKIGEVDNALKLFNRKKVYVTA